eukprot:GGOE01040103.1.p1 GENE.GGOE01040103.1~~GGOE01040103.1.p1  ORF type:complete len:161 (+),score=20.49 GGOE01040103.1:203-685(+)
MKPFKVVYAQQHKDWLKSVGFVDEEGNIKKASHNDLLNNVWHAWGKVQTSTVVKSFKCSGLGVLLDGSEDDMICMHDVHQEMLDLGFTSRKRKREQPQADQASSSNQVQAPPSQALEEEEDGVVDDNVAQIISDDEAASTAMDAMLARTVALGLRPRSER